MQKKDPLISGSASLGLNLVTLNVNNDQVIDYKNTTTTCINLISFLCYYC